MDLRKSDRAQGFSKIFAQIKAQIEASVFFLTSICAKICANPSMRKYFCFDFHKSKHKSKRAHTFSQLIAIMLAEIEARANTFTNESPNIAAQTE